MSEGLTPRALLDYSEGNLSVEVFDDRAAAELRTRWPLRRITVVSPDGWTPERPALIAHAIDVDLTY